MELFNLTKFECLRQSFIWAECCHLILYMLYIIYRLAKDSEAPRFGYIALFISLGLGVFGFVAKAILEQFLHV